MKLLLIFTLFLPILSVILLNSSTAQETSTLEKLEQLRWQNRIIIVKAVNNDLSSITDTLNQKKTKIDDRDILWFVVSNSANNSITSNYQGMLSKTLYTQVSSLLSNSNQDVILIGKDGDIKSKSRSLDLQKIFTQIDAMPMRILEMQTDKNADN